MTKNAEQKEINEGILVVCTLEGVSFKKGGSFQNVETGETINYDTTVKLDCSVPKVIEEDGIKVVSKQMIVLKIPVLEDDDNNNKLKSIISKYQQLIGKKIRTSVSVKKDYSVKVQNKIEVL
jgi:hypothetical protein